MPFFAKVQRNTILYHAFQQKFDMLQPCRILFPLLQLFSKWSGHASLKILIYDYFKYRIEKFISIFVICKVMH